MPQAGVCAYADGTVASLSASVHDRVYGHTAEFMRLAYMAAGFELYNTLATALFIPQQRTFPFLAHHITALTLALFSMHPYLHYYGFFFFGIAQVSSLPLCVANVLSPLCERYPAVRKGHLASQAVFAVLFLLVRTLAWPIRSWQFWIDSLSVMWDRSSHSTGVTVTYLACNLFMTGLQFVWGRKVVLILLRTVRGTQDARWSAARRASYDDKGS